MCTPPSPLYIAVTLPMQVTFHDFTGDKVWDGNEHNYQLECDAVKEYFAGTLDDQALDALPCQENPTGLH